MKKNAIVRVTQSLVLFAILIISYSGSLQSAHSQTLGSTWEVINSKGTGHSVGQAGDINSDGYSDIIVANPYYTNGHVHEGKIEVFYGTSTGFASTPAWSAESDRDSAYLGWSTAGMCDINHDGYTDVIAGAPGTGSVQGKAYIYYGTSSGLSSSAVTVSEAQAGERFGYSIATAEVNNDGYSEVFIGAPYNVTEAMSGKVYGYFGSSSGLTSSPNWSIAGNGPQSGFGWSLAVGSVTTSGTNKKLNLIIGAPGTLPTIMPCVTVTDALPIDPVEPPVKKFILTNNQPGSQFGYSVAIAGDINQDGYEDIITGAPKYSNGETNEGNATIYQGGSGNITAIWSLQSNEAGANFGMSVAGRGRVNMDAYDDIAITSPGSATSCLSVYAGTGSGIAASKYSLTNLTEEFSTVAFFRGTATGKGGILAGASSMTRGAFIGNGEVKYIKELDDIIKREGFAREDNTISAGISATLIAFPNPAAHRLTLDIASATVSPVSKIEVINTLGVIVHSMAGTLVTVNGASQRMNIELPSLPGGMYYVAVHMDGQKLFQPVQINQ